jgi:hypothetical protein
VLAFWFLLFLGVKLHCSMHSSASPRQSRGNSKRFSKQTTKTFPIGGLIKVIAFGWPQNWQRLGVAFEVSFSF